VAVSFDCYALRKGWRDNLSTLEKEEIQNLNVLSTVERDVI
jgi:hypothetical protein